MDYKEFRMLICEDYSRVDRGHYTKVRKIYRMIRKSFSDESFRITSWMRLGNWLLTKHNPMASFAMFFVKRIYRHEQHLTGIQFPLGMKIDGGLKFYHYSCVVSAMMVKIGRCCTIHQGVTLGRVYAGSKAGVPTIGDNVVIFPGAKVVGNIHVGDNVVIGANAVVVDDVPENCVVAGTPAKVVSGDSSKCFEGEWIKWFRF